MAQVQRISAPSVPPSVSTGRRAAVARNVAAPDASPVEALAPISLGGREETSFFFQEQGRRSGDRERERLPQSPLLRFQAPSETFAAVLDIQRAQEVESIPGISVTPGPPPFSGLVIRAISLYETTAQFLSENNTPRGDSVNNSI